MSTEQLKLMSVTKEIEASRHRAECPATLQNNGAMALKLHDPMMACKALLFDDGLRERLLVALRACRMFV